MNRTHYFGACPDCMQESAEEHAVNIAQRVIAGSYEETTGAWLMMHVGKENWLYCVSHQVRWWIGHGIFTIPDDYADEYKPDPHVLSFRVVEPV
jgi:hypothetical protein